MKISKIIEGRIRGWLPREPSSIILPHKAKLTNMRKPFKPSKINIALIFFVTILLLSVFAQLSFLSSIPSKYYPEYYLSAENLTVEPEEYFILSNPDQYVLKAINGENVIVRQTDTEICNLERQYGTSNVEYSGSYYAIQIAFVDSVPPLILPYILAGFVISIIGIVAIAIFQVVKHIKPTTK